MGADIVIAVDLNDDRSGTGVAEATRLEEPDGVVGEWIRKLQENFGALLPTKTPERPKTPSMQEVLFTSIDIMQQRITRSRLAGEPPDFIVSPRLAQLHLFDFHRAREAIDEGLRAVQAIESKLQAQLAQES
jgi:NTE family protein